MRRRGRCPIRFVVLTLATAAVGPFPGPGPVPARGNPAPETTQDSAAPSCENSCRGLGVEKVKAGDEHCGLVPRERKDEALDVACGLAESHHEELQQGALERAEAKCEAQRDRSGCRCQTELRSWQNVYTHVLSQRCWTECGWAALIECEPAAATDDAGDG